MEQTNGPDLKPTRRLYPWGYPCKSNKTDYYLSETCNKHDLCDHKFTYVQNYVLWPVTMDSTEECSFEHKLIISNFSYFKHNNHLKNQLISSDSIYKHDFISHLDFGIIDDNCFSIVVHLETLAKYQFKVIYRLSLKDFEGNDYFMKIYDKIVNNAALNSWKIDFELDFLESQAKSHKNEHWCNDQLTICCETVILKNANKFNLNDVEILNGQTTVPEIFLFNAKMRLINSFVHNWTIDGFSNFYDEMWKNNNLFKLSNNFGSNAIDNELQFHLALHPNGDGDEFRKYVSMLLFYSSPENLRVMVRWKVSMMDRNGVKRNTIGGQDEFERKHDNRRLADYISVSNVFDHHNGLLNDDRLILNCEVQVIDDKFDELLVIDVDEEQNITTESYLNAKPTVLDFIAHKWTIDNIESFFVDNWKTVKNYKGIVSNKFYSNKVELHLNLYPSAAKDGHLSIYLFHNTSENVENVSNVRWKISILDVKGEKRYTRCMFNVWKDEWRLEKYVDMSSLLEPSSELMHQGRLTLYCDVQVIAFDQTKSNEIVSQSVQNCPSDSEPKLSESKFKIISLVHQWTIDNFAHFYSPEWTKDNLEIESNKFCSNINSNKLQFHLGILPSGYEDEDDEEEEKNNNKGYVSLFLYYSSTDLVDEFVRLKFSLINSKGEKCNTKSFDAIYIGNADNYGFGDYIKVASLLELLKLGDGKLRLNCEIQIIDKEGRGKDTSEEDSLSNSSESYFNANPAVRESVVHKWTIEKFEHFMRQTFSNNNFEITSNKCCFSSSKQFEFCFRLNATVNLSVDLIFDMIQRPNVQLCIALIDNKGEKCYISYGRKTNLTNSISCTINLPIQKILSQFLGLLQNDSLIVHCEVLWLEDATIKATQMDKDIQQQNNRIRSLITETSTKFLFHTHSWTINDFGLYRTLVQKGPISVERYFECPKILNENIFDNGHSVQLCARLYPLKVSNAFCVLLCLDGNTHKRITQPLMAKILILSKKNESSIDKFIFKNMFSKQKIQTQVSYNKIHADGDLTLKIEFYTYTNSVKIEENHQNQFTLSFASPWKPKRLDNDSTSSLSVTSIPFVPYHFEWSIDTREQCEYWESPIYSPPVKEEITIFLKFNLKSKSVWFFTQLHYKGNIDIWIQGAILDRNQNTIFKKDCFRTLKTRIKNFRYAINNWPNKYTFAESYCLGTLDNWPDKYNFAEGKMTIECDIKLCKEKTEHIVSVCQNQIHIELHSLLTNEPQTDVVFQFGNDRKLYAHSDILNFKSKVFEDLFQESENKQIDIDFSDVDTFEEMLRYIYTENIGQMTDRADRLLTLADKYNLESLKAICENMVIAKLKAKSQDNIMQSPELLLLAHKHKASSLKDMAMEIINENKRQILGTNAWQEIKTDSDLIDEIFLYNSKEESLKRKRTKSN